MDRKSLAWWINWILSCQKFKFHKMIKFQNRLTFLTLTKFLCAPKLRSYVLYILSDKNSSDKSVEISAWCRKLCPTKHFVRRKFCPIFQYNSQVKIGQNCPNFDLVSKILSDEIFCQTKNLSDEILSDKVVLNLVTWY